MRRRPRVALVYDRAYPREYGGAERRFYELGRRISREFEVGFFFYGSSADKLDETAGRWIPVGGRRSAYTRGRRSVLHSAEFALRLAPKLSAFGADVVDCSSVSYAAIPLCAVVARSRRAALVVTWHEYMGDAWRGYLPQPLAEVGRLLERTSPRLPDANVAVSHFTARRLSTRAGVEARVIPNGVDLELIGRAPPGDETDVLFVGRLIQEKQADLLLEAARSLSPRTGTLRVTIVGDGPERRRIEVLARSLPANVSVSLISYVPTDTELYGLMKAAKTFVLPSRREGYALVVAEAQACGAVPIVVDAPASAAPELVEPERTGLVSPSTRGGLAHAISRLLENDELRREIRENALEASQARDWSRRARETADLYHELRS
ncbi:MAG: glycosyltransferase family 4 protein [Actinomycetota bacterium]|nr:glycosyltransferase family 4 protein [Actinomycetota bacterium]